MRTAHVYWLVVLVLALGGTVMATPLTITNADFSAISIACPLGYSYQFFGGDCNSIPPQQDFNGTAGFGWTLIIHSGIGLTAPNSPFQPPDFTGMPFTQALFLQDGACTALQAIGGFKGGTEYALSFYLGSRYWQDGVDGNQTVTATIDGNLIGTWALHSFTPFTLEHVTFSVPTDGTHTLAFNGTIPGDHTAFLSGVSIAAVPEPTSLLLLSSGALGAAAALRRSRK